MANRVLGTFSTKIHTRGYLAGVERRAYAPGVIRVTDVGRQGVSISDALRNPANTYAFQLNPAFFGMYGRQVNWFVERLFLSTAGVRGIILDISKGISVLDRKGIPIGPERRAAVEALLESAAATTNPDMARQLSTPVVAFIAQAYSGYIGHEYPEELQGTFLSHDGRYFLDQFCEIATRISTGNGIRAYRDLPGNITETPVCSYMAWLNDLACSQDFTASHNPGNQGGYKSGNRNGGVDTDTESEMIAGWVRYLFNGGKGRGWIIIGAEESPLRHTIDAKKMYWDNYLSRLISAEDIAMIETAMGRGAKFLIDGLWGALGPASEYYFGRMFPQGGWQDSIILMNNVPNPAMGGVEKPDPSDPRTLAQTGVLARLAGDPNIILAVSGDKDGDRTGPTVRVPRESVATAKKYGLFVSTMQHEGQDVDIVRFTPQQIFALNTFNRMLEHFERILGTRDVAEIQKAIADGRVDTSKLFIISTIPTSRIFHALAKMFNVNLVLTSVGYKYLGLMAKRIETQYGSDAVVFSTNEESGGANSGLIGQTDGRGSIMQGDKSTISIALTTMAASARCYVEDRNLVDLYVDMASKLGDLFYYERMDTYVPNKPTAESLEPEQMTLATATKQVIADKMFALERPEMKETLAGLFGYAPDQIVSTGTKILDNVFLMLSSPEDRECILVNPEVQTTTFSDGVEMQVMHAGVAGKEGPVFTFYDAEGNFRYMSCLRVSGTESLLRHYTEVAEPFDNPNPLNLVLRFDSLNRYLGFQEFGLAPGGPDYLTEFADSVTAKYEQ